MSRFLKKLLMLTIFIPSLSYGDISENSTLSTLELTEPIKFKPLFMERIWGGRRLEHFNKQLPSSVPIGESWEIADREDAQSIVENGILTGKTLHELWENFRPSVFGSFPDASRFPILIKMLDAKERLSVQVHPTLEMAIKLSGEPKTEMWYFMDIYGDGDIFAGLKKGITQSEFAKALYDGTVAEKIHRISVNPGEAFFIPSGRIHAIGAGNIIVEVQQNSDTTYRVFDWNRVGLDGKPRELHIEKSLQCINFNDFEPSIVQRNSEEVVACDYFQIEEWQLTSPREAAPKGRFAIFCCLSGKIKCGSLLFKPGEFFLVPASMQDRLIIPIELPAKVLRTALS